MMDSGMMGGGMAVAMGAIWLLAFVVLLLAAAAFIKFLRR